MKSGDRDARARAPVASLMSPEIRPVPVWASPADAVIRVRAAATTISPRRICHLRWRGLSAPSAGIANGRRPSAVPSTTGSRDLIQASHSSQTAVNGRPKPRESVRCRRGVVGRRARSIVQRGQSLRVDQVEDERAARTDVTSSHRNRRSPGFLGERPQRGRRPAASYRRASTWRSMPFSGASGFPGVDSSGARPRCPR